MNKVTVGAIAIVLLAFGGLVVWSSLNSGNKTNYDKYDTAKMVSADENNGNIEDHYRGKKDAEVIVVEYADFQCPGCASVMPKMEKLFKQYGDRVGFIFRSFPINGHQNARSASAAAESAGLQGFFWEMAAALYDNRADWIEVFDTEKRTDVYVKLFEEVAGGKGDVNKFKSDLNSADIQKKIDFDKNLGSKRDKVSATPSILINGEQVDFESEELDISSLIEKKIKDKLKNLGIDDKALEIEENKEDIKE